MKTFHALWIVGALALPALSQTYSIRWSKIAGGGGTSTNGSFSIVGTIGQHDAGDRSTNAVFSVTGGFWALPLAVQTPGAPVLHVAPGAPGLVVLSWDASISGFVLQETTDLSTSQWSNAPSGALNPTTIPVEHTTRFFRLHKP